MKRLIAILILPLVLVGCAKSPCKTTDAYWTNCTSKDGRHVGEWKDGMQNAQGTMTYPDGRVESGRWANGEFLGP